MNSGFNFCYSRWGWSCRRKVELVGEIRLWTRTHAGVVGELSLRRRAVARRGRARDQGFGIRATGARRIVAGVAGARSRRHRIRAVALVLGVRVTALGGSEDVDDEIRDGEFRVTAVSRFSRRAVHHLVARVADAPASDGVDVPMLAAGGATSFLDLGALAFGGRQIALLGFRAICKENCTNDVFVAMSLLVLFGFSFASSAIGFPILSARFSPGSFSPIPRIRTTSSRSSARSRVCS